MEKIVTLIVAQLVGTVVLTALFSFLTWVIYTVTHGDKLFMIFTVCVLLYLLIKYNLSLWEAYLDDKD